MLIVLVKENELLQEPFSPTEQTGGSQEDNHSVTANSLQGNADESEKSLTDPNCRIVRVTDIPSDLKDTTLELYFESEKRSGGGDIELLERVNESSAIITFAESSGELKAEP